MKTKYMVLAILIVSVIILAGCGEKTVYKDGDTEIVVDKGDDTVTSTIKTDNGEQTTVVSGTTGEDSWCPEGGEWNMASSGAQGDINAEWNIDKLETSGKYEGLCHVIYTMDSPEGKVKMDYYFSEDGKSGYFIMDLNGQKIEQEWTG